MIQTLKCGWRFENDPDGTKTAEAYEKYGMDLTNHIEKPQSTASANDKANLVQKLKDATAVLEQPDGDAGAEHAKIAELAELLEWFKKNHPEEISRMSAAEHINNANAGKFVKMGQDAKGTNVSFNPLALNMQENVGLCQKMTRKNDEPGAHRPADTDGGWVMVQQGPKARQWQEEEKPQQPKRQRRMNHNNNVLRAVCHLDIPVGPEMQEEFKSGIIDNPAHAKFQEYQDANAENAEKDARNKAKWQNAMLDLTDLDNAMSPVNQTTSEIKFAGEEMNTKGKVQSIFDQVNGDNKKSRRMEELIKTGNVQQWEEENGVDFPLKCVKLWEDCPNRKKPGLGPPETDEERGLCLMALSKRFRNECRYVTDRWTREHSPPPKVIEEDALATHLHEDIILNGKKFTTNSYGAFKLCNPQNRGQDSGASIYGNTVITALAATQGKEPAAGSGLQPTRTEEDDDHLPPTAKIINHVLAIQEDDLNVHWVRRIKTYSWDQILCENMQNCNLKDILSTWLQMPLVCQGCSLRGSRKKVADRRAKAEQELADVVQKAKNFLQANNLSPPNDPKDAKIIVKMALEEIAVLTFACPPMVQASVMSIPKAAVRDSKLHMQARAEYDERLTFPLEALMSFDLGDGRTVCQYLGMSRPDSQQTAVALKYYRCPYDFSFMIEGKGGTTQLGPYPCGAVTCARSDWHHSQRSGQGPKNIWQCTRCLGDWMKGRHGTMMVVVITGKWVMNLVLDSPPQDILQKWVKERIEYYERMEPCDTMRDEMPVSTPEQFKYRLELQGELSNAMWGILMGKHDDDDGQVAAFREIIRDAALSLRGDQDGDHEGVEEARKKLDTVTVSSAHKDENGRVWSHRHYRNRMTMQVMTREA